MRDGYGFKEGEMCFILCWFGVHQSILLSWGDISVLLVLWQCCWGLSIADKGLYSQSCGFPVVTYGWKSLTIKKAECRRIDAFELWCQRRLKSARSLQGLFDCKEIQPVNPKGNQSWILIGRTDAEAETTILWSPDVKGWLIRKVSDAWKDWRQEEKGMTEDEMAGCHHWLNGHEFEQAPGDGEGQGSLACCSPWSLKESDVTEWLNNNSNNNSK